MPQRKRVPAVILLVWAIGFVPVVGDQAAAQPQQPMVAIVHVRGTLEHPSWSQGMDAWIDRAAREFPRINVRTFDVDLTRSEQVGEPPPSPPGDRLRAVARSFGIVVVVGMVDDDAVQEVALEFPSVRFVLVDSWGPGKLRSSPNVTHRFFREEQAAFLAGVLAGLRTTTGRVGFIGSMRRTPALSRMAGFAAGVQFAAPRTAVLVDYAAVDPEVALLDAKWQQVAHAQFALGADVIYVSGAPSLEAPLRIAGSRGWIIGVTGPEEASLDRHPRLLLRVVKDYGRAVYDVVRGLASGKLPAADVEYSLRNGGVSYVAEPAKVAGPDRLRLKTIQDSIARGELSVPADPQALEQFLKRP